MKDKFVGCIMATETDQGLKLEGAVSFFCEHWIDSLFESFPPELIKKMITFGSACPKCSEFHWLTKDVFDLEKARRGVGI